MKCSLKEKMAYIAGGAAESFSMQMVNGFAMYFYTNVIGIKMAVVSIILTIGRMFDLFSDLLVGWIMEKIHSSEGKARPFIHWLYLPYGLTLFLVFSIPEVPMIWKIIYAAITYNLLISVIFTGLNIAHNALLSLITKNSKERSMLGLLKMLLAVAVGWIVSATVLPFVELLGGGQQGWSFTALLYGTLGSILYYISYRFTIEKSVFIKEKRKESIPLKSALKALVKNKYWVILSLNFFVNSFDITMSLGIYYAQYIMGNSYMIGTINGITSSATVLGMVLCVPLLQKFSRRTLNVSGCLLSFLFSILLIFLHQNILMFCICLFLIKLTASPVSATDRAMMADSIDYGESLHGHRLEGFAFGSISSAQKIGTALSTLLLGFVLESIGFMSGSDVQSQTVIDAIQWIFILVPIVVSGIRLILIYSFKLDLNNENK